MQRHRIGLGRWLGTCESASSMWRRSREGCHGSHAWELHIRGKTALLLVSEGAEQRMCSTDFLAFNAVSLVIDLIPVRLDVRGHILSTLLLGPLQLQRRLTGRHLLRLVHLYPSSQPVADGSSHSDQSPGSTTVTDWCVAPELCHLFGGRTGHVGFLVSNPILD